jgi:hypothetical protein
MSLKRKPPAGNVRRVASIGSNLRGTLTNKAGRIVQFESFAERSLLLRLERDQMVRDYTSQPETFHSKDVPRYTPDFLVWRQDGSMEIHEVTRSERRNRESQQAREELAVTVCQARGWRYVVHTEADLPQGHELSNLLSLVRYRPTLYRAELIEQSAICLLVEGKMALATLVRLLGSQTGVPQPQVAASLCHALWHGRFVTDWQQPILSQASFASQAQIWLPEAEQGAHS